MEEYLGQIVALCAGLVAIVGGTWKSDAKGIKKVTLTGYLTAALLFLGFGIAIQKHYASLDSKRKLNATLSETNENTEHLKSQLQLYQHDISSYKAKIDTYKDVIDRIDLRSERQTQIVFNRHIELSPGETYAAGNSIYGGSVIKPRGFDCDLQFENARTKFVMPRGDYGESIEYMVRGYSGRPMSWGLKNLSNRRCGGKFIIESTPRVRSAEWSDREESIR